jgi:outer membrane receptor protein involved in Fe transport
MKLLFMATDDLDFHLNLWYSHRDINGANRPLFKATEQSLAEFRNHDPETEDDAFDENTSADYHGYFKRRARGASIKTEWRPEISGVENASLPALFAYAQTRTPFNNDADFSPIDLLQFSTIGPDIVEQRSLELRFSGTVDGPFGWGDSADFMLGLYELEQKGEISNAIDVNLSAFPAYLAAGAVGFPQLPLSISLLDFLTLGSERIESYTRSSGGTEAIFSQYIWHMRDDLDLTLGLRLGQERKKADIGSVAYGDTALGRLKIAP